MHGFAWFCMLRRLEPPMFRSLDSLEIHPLTFAAPCCCEGCGPMPLQPSECLETLLYRPFLGLGLAPASEHRRVSGLPKSLQRQESVGSVVKVEGLTAHWFQKGDGFIQTHLPISQTPLGQLFEVEVVRAVNAGKRLAMERTETSRDVRIVSFHE